MPSATEYRDFWLVTVEEVPTKTGAADVMDCADVREVLDAVKLDLSKRAVLDVGCGTGRLAQLCGSWTGLDIAPPMVAYCIQHGLAAQLIEMPVDLLERYAAPWSDKPFDVACCLSVFTHIDEDMRRSYLDVFRRLAPEVLVDILPGDNDGDIQAWTADPYDFKIDLHEAGFTEVVAEHERMSADGYRHLYFRAR